MANKITTVQSSVIFERNRFEPKLFLFQRMLKVAQNKYKFVSLDSIASDIKRGQSPKPETYKDKKSGKYLFIRTADVKKYQFNTEQAVYLSEETFSTQRSNRVTKNDILISVVGNYLGSTSVLPKSIEKAVFNDNSAKIRIIDKNVSPYYVSAFLNSVFGQELIQSMVTRTGQKILSAGNVKKLFIPLIEDKNIENEYETAINKLDEANSLIQKARELFYSAIGINFESIEKEKCYSVKTNHFVDADLWTPKYSYPLYVNTIKAIQSKWTTVSIGRIASLKKGDEVGSDSYIGYLDKREGDVPFIRTSDIVNYEIDSYPDFYIPEEIYHELSQDFKEGDIIFTKDGKIGMTGMLTKNDKAIISSGFVGLRINDEAKRLGLTQEYLFLALTIKEIGIYESRRRTVVASTIPHLREERIKELEIPILDKNTIQNITEMVKRAFTLKNEKKSLLVSVRKMMDSYFEI